MKIRLTLLLFVLTPISVILISGCWKPSIIEISESGTINWNRRYVEDPPGGYLIEWSYNFKSKIIGDDVFYKLSLTLDPSKSGISINSYRICTYKFANSYNAVIAYFDSDDLQIYRQKIPLHTFEDKEFYDWLDKYPTKLEVNNSFMENKNIFNKVKRIEVSFTPTEACQFSNIKINGL